MERREVSMKQASVITPPSISASFQVLPFHPSYPVILTSGVSTIQGLLLTVPLPFALGSVLIIPDGAIPGSEQMENLSGEPTWHILVPNHSSVAPSAQPHRHQHQLRAPATRPARWHEGPGSTPSGRPFSLP